MHASQHLLTVAVLFASLAAPAAAQRIEVVNNQPFEINMPVQVRGVKLPDGATAAQQVGEDAVVVVTAPARATVQVPLAVPASVRMRSRIDVQPADSGIKLAFDGKDLGTLSWDVMVRPVNPDAPRTQEKALDTKADFAAAFEPVPLSFTRTVEGPVFDTWSAGTSDSGLKLKIELRAYKAGFVDIAARYANESAPIEDVYAAIICRWEQPGLSQRTLCYDNRVDEFMDGAYTPFRHGDGRHLYIQRGLDWINSTFADSTGVVWLKDFTPNFTTHHGPREGRSGLIGPRWLGANTAQVAQEAQAKEDAVYSISEIARPNVSMYRTRLADNVLPPRGEGLTIGSRMVFTDAAITAERADQHFIAYTGYNPQEKTENGATVTFGVPYTRFGTNYFPYSTLGENFVTLRQPGMSKEGYWPLAPETVKQYELFADDIRRDLRIAKSMGFELIRLHHLELLWDNAPSGKPYLTEQQRNAYLDFYFDELKHLKLKALLDVKLSPEQTAALVKRYRGLVDGVEIDNEILIFQIYDADVQYWKDVYAAVKGVAPEIPVHLTAHTNTGAFNRLIALGVPFDRVGSHAYMDSLEAINSGRDYALAVADYATSVNKPPLITEWNWRFLTRMTPEARAEIYRPIFENVLKPRCMPMLYQFQFNDGLAMNPAQLKGIRHYEQLNLSRRPKPEALEMVKLIQQYSNPAAGHRVLRTAYQHFNFADGRNTIKVSVSNTSDQPRTVTATAEGPPDLRLEIVGDAQFTIPPGSTATALLDIALAQAEKALPGFYHAFVRFDDEQGLTSYAWIEARKAGKPQFDRSSSQEVDYGDGAMDYDFNRALTVVYPVEASIMELEAAWVVYQTLEAATGRVVDIYQANDLPENVKHIIWVGSGKADKPTVKREGEHLIVTGKAQEDVMQAAMDLTLRYWRTAKDSGASRVGLVADTTGQGGVKTDLD